MSKLSGNHSETSRNDNFAQKVNHHQNQEATSRNGDEPRKDDVNYVLEGSNEQMEMRGAAGLEQEINQQDYDQNMLQNNEDVPVPQSPQNSPESVVDSVSSSNVPLEINRATDLLVAVSVAAEVNKTRIIDIVVSAMDELMRKAFEGEPLWQRQGDSEILNEAEYIREFRAFDASLSEIMKMVETGDQSNGLVDLDFSDDQFSSTSRTQKPPVPHKRVESADPFLTEASKEIGTIGVNPTTLVEWLMDYKQWSSMFSNIVSRATLLGVLSMGAPGKYDGTIQVMRAEFHMATPLVPIRECQFARYCKQFESNTWGVVDVSLEDLFLYPAVRFRRRPSGCIIQELANEQSKVIWVEHVQVNNAFVHKLFRPIVLSGVAFSAKRWVATLIRHCEWVATLMSNSEPTSGGKLLKNNGKESLMRLAGRMVRNFCQDISASSNNMWMPIPSTHDAQDCRLMTKSISLDPRNPSATIAFTTSIWIPASTKTVFDFLRNENSRSKWDILLTRKHKIREIAHIIIGQSPENRISIIQVKTPAKKIAIVHLQESISDPTGSYVVYAPIDKASMSALMKGGNPDTVSILPSGFVIHPDRPSRNGEGDENGGSILTIVFHTMDDITKENYLTCESVNTTREILSETAFVIKDKILSENLHNDWPVDHQSNF